MVRYNINLIYNLINLANIICFASIPFIYNYIPIEYYNYINNYLICYFFIDSFKNYNNVSILLHHSMYAFLIYKLNDFTLINYCLILDISTIFLLIIKIFKINILKPLFIFLWINLRFLYFPIITYYVINNYKNITTNSIININYNGYDYDYDYDYNFNKILILTASIISHNLNLFWSINFFDKTLHFKYALSSNFLHIVPVGFCLYYDCLTFEKFMISFYMYLISSIHHTFLNNNNYKLYYKYILSLDTSIISYISFLYIYNETYIKYIIFILNFILKIKYKNSKFHIILTSISIIKLIINNNYTIIIIQPGILVFINNLINNNHFNYEDLFLWHSSLSYAIANSFILN